MKKALLCAAALITLFAACKKDEGGSSSPSRRDTLTNGKWRTTALTARTNFFGTDTTFDLFANFTACEQDNLTIFNTNDSFYTDEGATKCNAGDAQVTAEGKWSLTNDSTLVLNTGGQSFDGAFKIKTLTSTSLQVQRDSSLLGTTATFTITYTHQN